MKMVIEWYSLKVEKWKKLEKGLWRRQWFDEEDRGRLWYVIWWKPTKSLTSTKFCRILPIFSPPRSILTAAAAVQFDSSFPLELNHAHPCAMNFVVTVDYPSGCNFDVLP
ncbi:hypothetical protein QL285_076094 [Trifolium repens]|nr:hypothetical protein QL285_076094 [Trifolium repens]